MKQYDKDGNLMNEMTFIEPNILLLKVHFYVSGSVKRLTEIMIELLENHLPIDGEYHYVKIYPNKFFERNIIVDTDYSENHDLFLKVQNNWTRLLNITVTDEANLSYRMTTEKAPTYLNQDTKNCKVGTLDEAMTLIQKFEKSEDKTT